MSQSLMIFMRKKTKKYWQHDKGGTKYWVQQKFPIYPLFYKCNSFLTISFMFWNKENSENALFNFYNYCILLSFEVQVFFRKQVFFGFLFFSSNPISYLKYARWHWELGVRVSVILCTFSKFLLFIFTCPKFKLYNICVICSKNCKNVLQF